MANKFQVAIIGAGLAGPTLALCLKKQHNICCTIYELRPGLDERGTNVSLTPNALRVMQHIGVYDKLREQGYNYEEVAFSNGSGEQLGKFLNGSEKLYNFRSLRIHRKKVQQVLLNEAHAQGIDIHYGMRLVSLDESKSDVKLHFENGITVSTDFVIGADGIHSRVRPSVAITKPIYSGYLGITGIIGRDQLKMSAKDYCLPNMFFGKSGFMAIMPSSFDGSEIGFFSTMEFDELSRSKWDELFNRPEAIQEILTQRFDDGWPELIRGICTDVPGETLATWPFYVVPPINHYVSQRGRVIIIGDAAHAITPQGGQGAGMAFEDAETLAYTMARINFVEDRSNLLLVWETHRQQRLEMVKEFTNRNTSLRDPGRSHIRQHIKEYIVWAFFKCMGPSAGVEWLYGYEAEDIIGILGGQCHESSMV